MTTVIYRHFRFIVVLGVVIGLFNVIRCTPRVSDNLSGEPDVIFKAKCSKCHSIDRALTATKDEAAWRQTIILMSQKPGSGITPDEIERLVRLHTERQKKEQDLFYRDCGQCHEPGWSLAKAGPPAKWREIIKRMLAKRPGLASKEDIELLTNYHLRQQRLKLARMLKAAELNGIEQQHAAEVFVEECSTCHDLQRALTAVKDEAAWRQTITAMSEKQDSPVKQDQVEELVRFHVKRQELEQEIFKQRCTTCHPAKRALEKIKTRDEWRETIKRMAAKAPEQIPDEQIDLLVDFHRRNEKKNEQFFRGICTECHDLETALSISGDIRLVDKTIVSMIERAGKKVSYDEITKLINFHNERQKKEQLLFEKDCTKCHAAERSLEKKKAREEWRDIIRRMQEKAPELIDDDEIDFLISYHIRKSKGLQ
ncbi:MAG: c-type cytochrome [Thermodesulfobacteriota bacterium]